MKKLDWRFVTAEEGKEVDGASLSELIALVLAREAGVALPEINMSEKAFFDDGKKRCNGH